jgi:hypothetical protein
VTKRPFQGLTRAELRCKGALTDIMRLLWTFTICVTILTEPHTPTSRFARRLSSRANDAVRMRQNSLKE